MQSNKVAGKKDIYTDIFPSDMRGNQADSVLLGESEYIQVEKNTGQLSEKKTFDVPFRYAQQNRIILQKTDNADNGYTLIYENTLSLKVLSELQRTLGVTPLFEKAPDKKAFDALLQAHYSAQNQRVMADGFSDDFFDLDTIAASLDEPEDLLNSQDEAPIIRLLNAIFFEAIRSHASDVHIQPREKMLQIRLRLDGVLHTKLEQSVRIAPLLVSRVKVLARLDIAEKRLPQDGRIAIKIGGKNVDMRVSTIPSAFGERVVMRLLDKSERALSLQELGVDSHVYTAMKHSIAKPHGIVLVTGPTGSGKTTTLYGSLMELDNQRLNIMTIEDPIEYYFDGISQTQINKRADMTFARGLRAILRQDPDVVMIGEIRDFETAEIAIQASLTGHLMLSTLHTNTAVGAITRLLDMGLPAFLLASTIHTVVSQRLVRKLCTHCRIRQKLDTENANVLRNAVRRKAIAMPKTMYTTKDGGCPHCYYTGYQGRIGIYEILQMDEKLRDLVHEKSSENSIHRYVRDDLGVESLRDNGFAKVLAGLTSIHEVLRVTQS